MNRIFINDEGIVECRVVGDQTPESIAAMGEEIRKLLSRQRAEHRPLLILDDITQMGKVPSVGRQAVIQLLKTLQYHRLVMLGDNGMIRLGANLIFRASGRGKKMRYFTDRAGAVEWLLKTKP